MKRISKNTMEKKNFFAPSSKGLGATRRAAALLLVMMLTATTAWAQTTSTINVGGTDYTLFTGFTATDGNGNNWANLVDGNTSTDWIAEKTRNPDPDPDPDAPPAPTGDFAGGTEDPAFVEFHADAPIIPKGYVLTCDDEDAGFWKPVQWALKARLNEGDAWTTIHSSNTTLGAGKTFEIPCSNDGNNKYQYFRFEVYEVGATTIVDLDELQFYGLLPTYTHLTVKAATCTATGIKRDCYRRNSDGKYFTDETGATELAESDVIAPMIPHTGEHHEATDVNIEYWQCSMCGKYFSDEDYTTEITEEQTKIYRTITIDGSISKLVTSDFSQALAGETIPLYVSYLIDASTLKVNNGAVELTAMTDIQYTFTMPAADVTVTAEVAQSNADGDNLTGSIRHTVTIPHGASITLNDAAISGSIVCEGSATITLVGTNSVSGATNTAGIQIGGSGTTLTIRGDGSLTANGGAMSAGIGLSRAWDPDDNVIGGDIVIEGGNITARGGSQWGAGIGTGVIYGNGSAKTARIGNITIKGGTVKATGGTSADGIGTGYTYTPCTNAIGTVTIYDGIDKVDASSIKNSGSIVYKHDETDVTDSKADYFTIIENGNRRIIVQKVTPAIADVPDQTYTGSAITPEPLVQTGSLILTKGTDYTYSYENNTDAGTATVRATFQGTYASLGYVEKEFKIVKSMTNNDITVTIPSQTYTGSAIEPAVTVKDGETTLTLGTDYEVAYSNNVNAGTATVTITGKGNYSDSKEATFTISPRLARQAGAVYIYQDQNGMTALLDGTSVDPVDIDFNHNIIVNHVTSNRVFTPGKPATVMLPFDYTCIGEEGGTFYKFVGVEKVNYLWVATMQETGNDTNKQGTLEANTPYLFMPAATTMTFPNINGSVRLFTRDGGSGGNCETADPGSHWTFKGTYEYKEWQSGGANAEEIGRAYGFAGVAKTGIEVGDFVKVANGAKIRPMCCYLLWNNEPNSANARSFTRGAAATAEELPQRITVRLVGSNGQTTAIGTLDTKTGEIDFSGWYDMSGHKLSGKPTKKGLYINNGKKVVIK